MKIVLFYLPYSEDSIKTLYVNNGVKDGRVRPRNHYDDDCY